MNHLRRKLERIHFVGIGGIGMSGIAELLVNQGFKISGSDLSSSPITEHLRKCGCTVWEGHHESRVKGANAVVYSSAVGNDNPELLEANRQGIPVIRRAEMLGELMRLKSGIAIAGTHGKTTTTSMIGHILTTAGFDPTVIVGGVLRGLGTNARLGNGEYLVAEADEYDRSFLNLSPTLSVITSLEAEHLDTYGDFSSLREAFRNFANSVPFYGMVAVCSDDPNLVELLPEISRPVVTYGFNPHANIRGEEVQLQHGSRCRILEGDNELGELNIPLTGRHNLSNALGAVVLARELGVPFEVISESMASFEGVKRRFELRDEIEGVSIYDDYAHHPTEVQMTLDAARLVAEQRVVAVFQPHLYSRTELFFDDFAKALLATDLLVVTDVYPSREEPVEGVSGRLVYDRVLQFGHTDAHYVEERGEIAPYLARMLLEGDMVITLGAGDIYRTSNELIELLKAEEVK